MDSDQENGSIQKESGHLSHRILSGSVDQAIETEIVEGGDDSENPVIVPLLRRTISQGSNFSGKDRSSRELRLRESFDKDFIDREAEPCEDGEGKECGVCYYSYNEDDFFALSCQHTFCVNCVADHLRINIESGKAFKLPCMEVGCKLRFEAEQIQ